MEKRRNFVGFFFIYFGRIRTEQKIASVEENNPYRHTKRKAKAKHRQGSHREARERRKKRLVEADGEE